MLESCFLLLEDSYAWSLVSCYWKTLMLGILFLVIGRLLCLGSCFLLLEAVRTLMLGVLFLVMLKVLL